MPRKSLRLVSLNVILVAAIVLTVGARAADSIESAAGFVASHWIARAIVVLAPPAIPRLADVAINVPVALFSSAIVAAAAVLCGAAPVRQAGAFNLVDALNDAARGTPGKQVWRARSLLLVVQISLTVLLLVAGGLVVRSFLNLQRINLGFVAADVVMLNVTPRNPRPSVQQWMAEFLRRVETLPDVDAARAVCPLSHCRLAGKMRHSSPCRRSASW